MRNFLALILVCLGSHTFAVDTHEAKALFDQACELYEEQEYEAARDTFLLINEEYQSFALNYNLGNTYFRLEQIGPAMLHYHRAKRIDPYDEDLITNLQIASLQTDKIESIPTLGVQDLWDKLTRKGMLRWWSIITIAGSAIGFGMLILFIYARSRNQRRIFFLSAVFALFIGTGSLAMGMTTQSTMNAAREAIIFSPKVEVLNAPSGDQTEFVIHEGTKVRIKSIQGEWYEIRISNGSVGWLHQSNCEVI